jgi:hypothetical protein
MKSGDRTKTAVVFAGDNISFHVGVGYLNLTYDLENIIVVLVPAILRAKYIMTMRNLFKHICCSSQPSKVRTLYHLHRTPVNMVYSPRDE